MRWEPGGVPRFRYGNRRPQLSAPAASPSAWEPAQLGPVRPGRDPLPLLASGDEVNEKASRETTRGETKRNGGRHLPIAPELHVSGARRRASALARWCSVLPPSSGPSARARVLLLCLFVAAPARAPPPSSGGGQIHAVPHGRGPARPPNGQSQRAFTTSPPGAPEQRVQRRLVQQSMMLCLAFCSLDRSLERGQNTTMHAPFCYRSAIARLDRCVAGFCCGEGDRTSTGGGTVAANATVRRLPFCTNRTRPSVHDQVWFGTSVTTDSESRSSVWS